MTKETVFRLSHKPYAVALESLVSDWIPTVHNGIDTGSGCYRSEVEALWYRRKRGILYVCVGVLWGHSKIRPYNCVEFLERHDDGRYGGSVDARWDGSNYWSSGRPDEQQRQRELEIMKRALDNYPQIPAGYDGWWVFEKE